MVALNLVIRHYKFTDFPREYQEEAVSKLNCTPKVEHKTFGVQFSFDSLFLRLRGRVRCFNLNTLFTVLQAR